MLNKLNSQLSLGNIRQLSQQLNLSGVFAPLTTPFDSNGHIDYGALCANLDKYEADGIDHGNGGNKLTGYVIMGTTGEFPFLSLGEKLEIAKTIRSKVNSSTILICGTGCQSTSHTIELTNRMADLGIGAALIHAPSSYKDDLGRNSKLLIKHYLALADGSNIPFLIYNMPPSMGAIDIGIDTLIELALLRHPNIIGLKECSNDIVKLSLLRQRLLKERNETFQVLTGSASFLYPTLVNKCAIGGICALANVLPSQLCQLYQTPTEPAHHLLLRANEGTHKRFGIPGIKAAMDIMGYVGGHCRAPLALLGQKERAELKSLYSDLGFIHL